MVEFKKGDKEIEKVFTGQVKAAMKEKDPSTAYVLGMYYDTERLFLFHRREGRYLRYDEAKNQKGKDSKVGDLSLHLPDTYFFIPSFEELKNRVHLPTTLDRSKRGIRDLDIITSIATVQLQTALSDVLRALDKAGLVNQRGYQVLIETFALKIFDEKRNEKNKSKNLQFYITSSEVNFYHRPAPPPVTPLTLGSFVHWHRQWNEALGIWELDREMKRLQAELAEVQGLIIDGKPVTVPMKM